MHAIANIPAQCPGAFIARFPGHVRLPRSHGRVGLRIYLFETCSAFTLVTACILARSPTVTLYTEGFSHLSFCGCSNCFRLERQFAGWGSHPQGRRAFPRRTWQLVWQIIDDSAVDSGGLTWPRPEPPPCYGPKPVVISGKLGCELLAAGYEVETFGT